FARYPGVDHPRRARRLAAVAVGKAQALAIDGLGSAGSLASVAAKTSIVPHQSRSAPVWDRNEPSDSSGLSTGLFPLHGWLNMHGVADALQGPRQSGQR